ncbi:MAG: hypothetical protein ACFFC7_29460 [Candidatus Hermodarchaeota archaeon]
MTTSTSSQTSTSLEIDKMLSCHFSSLKTKNGTIITYDNGLGTIPDLFDMCLEIIGDFRDSLIYQGDPEISGLMVQYTRIGGLGIYPAFFVSLGDSMAEGRLTFASFSNNAVNWPVTETLIQKVSTRFEQILSDIHQTTTKSDEWNNYQVLVTKKLLADTSQILNVVLTKTELLGFDTTLHKRYMPVVGAIFDYTLDFADGHLQFVTGKYFSVPTIEDTPLEGKLFRDLFNILQKPLKYINESSLTQRMKFLIHNSVKQIITATNFRKVSDLYPIISKTPLDLDLEHSAKFKEFARNFIAIWLLPQIIHEFVLILKEQTSLSLIDEFAYYFEKNLKIQLYLGQISLKGSDFIKDILDPLLPIFNQFIKEKKLTTVKKNQLDHLLKSTRDIPGTIRARNLIFEFPFEDEKCVTEFYRYVLYGFQSYSMLLPKKLHIKLKKSIFFFFLDYLPGKLSNKLITLYLKEVSTKEEESIELSNIEKIASDLLKTHLNEVMDKKEEER